MQIDLPLEYERLGDSYDAFARLLDEASDEELFEPRADVSAWSPAQHLHHILIANGMMLKGIQLICQGGSRILPTGALNDSGRYVLAKGFVRGAGKAPEPTHPPEALTREDLRATLQRSRARYEGTEPLLPQIAEAEGFLAHGFLGELDASQWLRLARVHSEHHLAIIADITAQKAA